MIKINKTALELFLPEGMLEWFDVKECDKDEENIYITLEEKNEPPSEYQNQKIIFKGFHDITITDFPARGKRVLLKIKRRYWQIEGQKKLIKRDIKLSFPGTKLEAKFALFLKEDGGRKCGLTNFYRKVSQDPSQRI